MFISWLKKEVKPKWLVVYVLLFIPVYWIANGLMAYLMSVVNIQISIQPKCGLQLVTENGTSAHGVMCVPIFTVVLMTINITLEEVFWRLPLILPLYLRWSAKNVLIVAVILSCFFGSIHGGISHIPLQGMCGFLLSLMFLKCGGFQGKYCRAFSVVLLTHLIFDGICVALLILIGCTSL